MKNIILKDLRLQRWVIIIGVILQGIVCNMNFTYYENNKEVYSGFIAIFIIGVIASIGGTCRLVNRESIRSTGVDTMLRSLPVSKETIILSKLIVPLITYGIPVLISVIVSIINYRINDIKVNYEWIIAMFLGGFIISYILNVLNLYSQLVVSDKDNKNIVYNISILVLVLTISISDYINFESNYLKSNSMGIMITLGILVLITIICIVVYSNKIILKKYKALDC